MQKLICKLRPLPN